MDITRSLGSRVRDTNAVVSLEEQWWIRGEHREAMWCGFVGDRALVARSCCVNGEASVGQQRLLCVCAGSGAGSGQPRPQPVVASNEASLPRPGPTPL